MNIILNADDFGISAEVNLGIKYCFEKGFCSTASLMPNMPNFDEACEIAHEAGFADRLGVHLTLGEGEPLTNEIRCLRRFCSEDGQLCLAPKIPVLFLSTTEQRALAREIRAQIVACKSNGIEISHLDSHNHTHNEWAILNVVLPIAREEKISFIRPTRNIAPSKSLPFAVYKTIYNKRLRRGDLLRCEGFGSVPDLVRAVHDDPNSIPFKSIELMLHPAMYSAGTIVDTVENCLVFELLNQVRGVLPNAQIVCNRHIVAGF